MTRVGFAAGRHGQSRCNRQCRRCCAVDVHRRAPDLPGGDAKLRRVEDSFKRRTAFRVTLPEQFLVCKQNELGVPATQIRYRPRRGFRMRLHGPAMPKQSERSGLLRQVGLLGTSPSRLHELSKGSCGIHMAFFAGGTCNSSMRREASSSSGVPRFDVGICSFRFLQWIISIRLLPWSIEHLPAVKLTYAARQRAAVVLWAICTGSNRLFHCYNFFRDFSATPVSAHPVVPTAGAIAVDGWKAVVPGGFRYAAASLPAMAPFPGVTVRTEPANFVYPALRGDDASRTQNLDCCDLRWRNFG